MSPPSSSSQGHALRKDSAQPLASAQQPQPSATTANAQGPAPSVTSRNSPVPTSPHSAPRSTASSKPAAAATGSRPATTANPTTAASSSSARPAAAAASVTATAPAAAGKVPSATAAKPAGASTAGKPATAASSASATATKPGTASATAAKPGTATKPGATSPAATQSSTPASASKSAPAIASRAHNAMPATANKPAAGVTTNKAATTKKAPQPAASQVPPKKKQRRLRLGPIDIDQRTGLIIGGAVAGVGALLLVARRVLRGRARGQAGQGAAPGEAAAEWGSSSSSLSSASPAAGGTPQKGAAGAVATGPFSKLKPSAKCVPLADGSACVVRREIAADNSCLFNAVGYAMHHSKTRAGFLRGVVAREVSSDPTTFNEAFLGMHNVAYCNWIQNPVNWGGGIEISILSQHYNREIAAWNIESGMNHVFGEEQGYPKQVSVIYNGVHYDALAIAKGPRANPQDDVTEYNPRTKRGKMIVEACRKLTDLARRSKGGYVKGQGLRLKCGECGVVVNGQAEAANHAEATGHVKFEQVKK